MDGARAEPRLDHRSHIMIRMYKVFHVLCKLNWRKENEHLVNPTWKTAYWIKHLLIDAARYSFAECDLRNISLDFIEDGTRPLNVYGKVEAEIRASGIAEPKSPRECVSCFSPDDPV